MDFRCQAGIPTSSASDSGLDDPERPSLETPLSDDPTSVPDVSEEELRQYEPAFMRMLAKTKTKTAQLNFLYDIMRKEDDEATSVPEGVPRFPDEYVEEFNFERVTFTLPPFSSASPEFQMDFGFRSKTTSKLHSPIGKSSSASALLALQPKKKGGPLSTSGVSESS